MSFFGLEISRPKTIKHQCTIDGLVHRLPIPMGTTLAATTTVKVETRNNQLEMQFVNNKALIEELDKLLKRLRILLEYATCLIGGSFDEARMLQYIKACEWLAGALNGLEPGEEKLDKIEQVMPKFCKNLCT